MYVYSGAQHVATLRGDRNNVPIEETTRSVYQQNRMRKKSPQRSLLMIVLDTAVGKFPTCGGSLICIGIDTFWQSSIATENE